MIPMYANQYSIIIVTYNSSDCILDLLHDINSLDEGALSRTVIVDNNSSDECVSAVQTNYPQVQILVNKVNIGYGSAVNQAVGFIDTRLFFLLNPDIRLPENFFSNLMMCVQSTDFGAAGPLQFKLKGKTRYLNFCWSFLKLESFKLYLQKRTQPKKSFCNLIPVTFLNAGCLLFNKSAYIQVGGFDERYFLYGEEPDIFLKFKLHGYKCYLHSGVEIIHLRDKSIKKLPLIEYIKVRSRAVINIVDALLRGYSRFLTKTIATKYKLNL
jgi:N-acetylglucosaminyl-diphospho-decaprenol L-rhamnosyltransferase